MEAANSGRFSRSRRPEIGSGGSSGRSKRTSIRNALRAPRNRTRRRSSKTVSAFLDAYYERCAKPAGLRSLATVESQLRRLKEQPGHLPLDALEDPDEINRFKASSDYAEDLEIASMYSVLERLRAAMNWGLAQTPPLFTKSPFHRFGVRMNKKAETVRDRRVSREEEKRLVDTALHKMKLFERDRRRIAKGLEVSGGAKSQSDLPRKVPRAQAVSSRTRTCDAICSQGGSTLYWHKCVSLPGVRCESSGKYMRTPSSRCAHGSMMFVGRIGALRQR